MSERLRFVENQPQLVSRETAEDVAAGIEALRQSLRPQLAQLELSGQTLVIRNLVGSARLPSGRILEVEPKVPATASWAESVVQLLTDDSRVSVTGSQRTRQSRPRNDLTSAIAVEYARRLEAALGKEGPIQIYERQSHIARRLNGRLDVGRWARLSHLDPAMFPVTRDEFTVDNDFTRGLSIVAGYFRRSSLDASLGSRLRRLESAVLPGMPLPNYVDPSVASRRLPVQWRSYRPAWDIAAAVLRNRSVVGDPGHSVGLEVALEPWPLLETLLERSLNEVGRLSLGEFNRAPKAKAPLLLQYGRMVQPVIPDGVLVKDGAAVATFEAKYTNPDVLPAEAHIYQALAAAGALDSPLAVLVYPDDAGVHVYDVAGRGGLPLRFVSVGLDLFTYRRVDGDSKRAETLLRILHQHTPTRV
ncbi:hypothetical protein Q9S36_14805 [Microbacterium sp. ARD31]|uniref:5-methylcytosine restriction system specificity protein McrC n=1 Tax=Microbacterium sp. ARD31 TaxID=2962576 RepID=UPI002881A800|nr:hypothetical protein [Microbacterium sp. ARD31]MDT0181450.1 hypothetical protein [Microbacterium sp. ARD31]